MKNKALSKKLKYGTVAAILTVLFIVFIAVINIILSAASEKYPLYFDMTSEELYDISDASLNELSDGKNDVSILFFAKEDKLADVGGSSLEMISKLAKKYGSLFPNVHVEYIDLVSQPNAANKYKKTSSDRVTQTTVIFTCEATGASKIVQRDGFFTFMTNSSTGAKTVHSFDGEKRITSCIKQVANATTPTALFTTGHGEPSPTGLWIGSTLEKEGYEVKTVNLSNEEIPDGTELLVVYYPQYDFAGIDAEKAGGTNEISRFSNYLKDFGNVIVVLSPTTRSELSELSALLSEWGISYTSGAIVTESPANALDNDGFFVIGNYAGEEDSYAYQLHKGVSESASSPRPIAMYSVPLSISEVSGKVVQPVITSSKDAHIATNEETSPAGREVPLVALSVAPKNNIEGELDYCNLLVIGSPYFFDASIASISSYGNSEILYGALKYFGSSTATSSIDSKVLANTSLKTNATGETSKNGIIVMSVIVPLIILAIGVLVWRKRRYA